MKAYLFDGAMGTMLQQRGLSGGGSPEALNVEAPEVVKSVHLDYLKAGSDIIITNTFGGSSAKLKEYGLAEDVALLNRRGVEIAKEACAEFGRGLVAASIGPTGYFVAPLGELSFEEMVLIFTEQAQAIALAEPDYILLETFSDLGEIRAALLACKAVCTIPVLCSLTYMGKRTLTGVSPKSAAVTLESLGAAAIGCNCSGGPEELLGIVAELAEYTNLPLLVQPNAGIPHVVSGQVQYPLDGAEFAREMAKFLPYQVVFLGGCCGTTPNHIRLLKETLANYTPISRELPDCAYLASREEVVQIGADMLPKLIGERINPTARKKLAQGLRDGDYALIQKEAESQILAGAHLLDINVGTHGLDEAKTMVEIVGLLQQGTTIPLVLDSTKAEVLAGALAIYHGKALINSINGEQSSMDAILPLAKRYGAAVVALTLDEEGIPKQAEGRLAIARKIVANCVRYGIKPKDIYVDALVLTVGTDVHGPRETLQAMKMIKEELGVNLLLGVSNVSYGLPNRSKINSAFLAMAIAQGLDVAIINPMDELMQGAWQSASLLLGRDPNGENFIKCNQAPEQVEAKAILDEEVPSLALVANLVVKGGANLNKVIDALLKEGVPALSIINEGLIIGLEEVGRRYEEGIFYLPQLMLSAETAQKAFGLLEASLGSAGELNKGTMVIGTVKGDVHDIGKNMVAVMVKNHGYKVIDLGKNVPAQDFVQAVIDHKAQFLGLSALMTTTMVEIPQIIKLLRDQAPQTKVIIGGAVITADFAKEAGADGYGKDAISTVKILGKWHCT